MFPREVVGHYSGLLEQEIEIFALTAVIRQFRGHYYHVRKDVDKIDEIRPRGCREEFSVLSIQVSTCVSVAGS